MEFNTNKRDALEEAVKPRAIKAQTSDWASLEGYVYVIFKKMPIRQNGKMRDQLRTSNLWFSRFPIAPYIVAYAKPDLDNAKNTHHIGLDGRGLGFEHQELRF